VRVYMYVSVCMCFIYVCVYVCVLASACVGACVCTHSVCLV